MPRRHHGGSPEFKRRIFKALILEDDHEFQDWLESVLDTSQFHCVFAASLLRAKNELRAFTPDVMLLDEGLPDGSGLDFCQSIRKDHRLARVPIAILTGRRRIVNQDKWLAVGADACWSKPMNSTRLIASLLSLIRRREWDTATIKPLIPGLVIDLGHKLVVFREVESNSKLSDRELRFLNLLCNAHPETLPNQDVLENVANFKKLEQGRLALRQMVRRLKQKLPPELADSIRAVHRAGYRLELPAVDVR